MSKFKVGDEIDFPGDKSMFRRVIVEVGDQYYKIKAKPKSSTEEDWNISKESIKKFDITFRKLTKLEKAMK